MKRAVLPYGVSLDRELVMVTAERDEALARERALRSEMLALRMRLAELGELQQFDNPPEAAILPPPGDWLPSSDPSKLNP